MITYLELLKYAKYSKTAADDNQKGLETILLLLYIDRAESMRVRHVDLALIAF